MKNTIIVSSTAVMICAMFIISTAFKDNPSIDVANANSHQSDIQEVIDDSTRQPLYIAKALDGYIAIYVPSDSSPFLLTDIDMRTLRYADQEKIALGMPLYSQEELSCFLEDFGT